MHNDHDTFIDGIHGCTKVVLTFYSKQDGHTLTRTCAPMTMARAPGRATRATVTTSGITTAIPADIRLVCSRTRLLAL